MKAKRQALIREIVESQSIQTQEELAERIDRSAAFVGHVEAPNIKKAISMDTLFSIAQALDIPAYRFLIFDDSGL